MISEHGNYTDNTSFVDVLKTLKQNIFRTLYTAELAVVREIADEAYKCEMLTNRQVYISAIKFQDLDVQINDVVMIIFTGSDYRASLSAYKRGEADTSMSTSQFHQSKYGVIVGLIYHKTQEEEN